MFVILYVNTPQKCLLLCVPWIPLSHTTAHWSNQTDYVYILYTWMWGNTYVSILYWIFMGFTEYVLLKQLKNNILSSCEFVSCLDYWGTLLEYYWITYISLSISPLPYHKAVKIFISFHERKKTVRWMGRQRQAGFSDKSNGCTWFLSVIRSDYQYLIEWHSVL